MFFADKLLNFFSSSNFFTETSCHSINQLSRVKKSIQMVVFWILVSVLTLIVSSYQIYTDIGKLRANNMNIVLRTVHIDEIQYPNISDCYSHWALWLNWTKCYHDFNLTKHEIFSLMYPLNNKVYSDDCFDIEQNMISAVEKLNMTNVTDQINMNEIIVKLNRLRKTSDDSIHLMNLHNQSNLLVCFRNEFNTKQLKYPAHSQFVSQWEFDRHKIARNSKLSEMEIDVLLNISKLGFVQVNDRPIKHVTIQELAYTGYCSMALSYEMQCRVEKAIYVQHDESVAIDINTTNQMYGIGWKRFFFKHMSKQRLNYMHGNISFQCPNRTTNKYDTLVADTLNTFFFHFDQVFLSNPYERLVSNCPRFHVKFVSDPPFILYPNPIMAKKVFSLSINFTNSSTWSMLDYEESFSIWQLVSNVGGTLGIWMGSSIVSVIHLVYSCIAFISKRLVACNNSVGQS